MCDLDRNMPRERRKERKHIIGGWGDRLITSSPNWEKSVGWCQIRGDLSWALKPDGHWHIFLGTWLFLDYFNRNSAQQSQQHVLRKGRLFVSPRSDAFGPFSYSFKCFHLVSNMFQPPNQFLNLGRHALLHKEKEEGLRIRIVLVVNNTSLFNWYCLILLTLNASSTWR